VLLTPLSQNLEVPLTLLSEKLGSAGATIHSDEFKLSSVLSAASSKLGGVLNIAESD
jgi:hypothetical protein